MNNQFFFKQTDAIIDPNKCFWELCTRSYNTNPAVLNAIVEDKIHYSYNYKVSWEEILLQQLNRRNLFEFVYAPSMGDFLILSFPFEGNPLRYTFTYNSVKWQRRAENGDRVYCIEKSISGEIANPMSLLLYWAM